ncbi:hypothetical protein IJM86_03865 [bacterium]|nr:hypothetical protein [bacterium]
MKITTYNGEYFERSKVWFLIFFLVISVFLFITVFFSDLFSAVIILLVVGAYFYFILKVEDKIEISLTDEGVFFGDFKKRYEEFTGFSLEYNTLTKKIHNIIFLTKTGTFIYTLQDEEDEILTFSHTLAEYVPFIEKYAMSFFSKLLRKMKI